MREEARKILVVDDDRDLRDLLCDFLAANDYSIVSAGGGLEALRKVVETAPDIIILDINLPDMSGWDVLGKIRIRRESMKTPVVIISGSCEARRTFSTEKPVNCKFLEKPFDFEAMLGALKAVADEGKGRASRFEYDIAAGINPDVHRAGHDRPGCAEPEKKVLIVDDDPFMRKKLRAILEAGGFRVIGEAEDGDDALAICRRVRPDLVTMDIVMKRMGGIQALKTIMNEMSDMKVVMVTQVAVPSIVKECMAAGAANFVLKPFHEQSIVRVMDNAIRG